MRRLTFHFCAMTFCATLLLGLGIASPVCAAAAEPVLTISQSELERIVAAEVTRQTASREQEQITPKPHQGIKKGDVTITPYGYFNLSASFNSQHAGVGDYALWTLSPDDVGKGSEFFLDPKSTRLGLKVAGPRVYFFGNASMGGTVEIDFQQPAHIHRNRAGVMLRQAYFEIAGKENRFLVGQTWDVASPLFPAQLAYVPGGTTNLGYRRPQIRFEKNCTDDVGRGWVAQFAITDNVVMDNQASTGLTSTGSLYGVGWPQLQGRLARKFRGVTRDLPIVCGVSGHVGEYREKNLAASKLIPTWSANIDLDLPFHSKWRFTSELATGECLSTLLGSAMIGYDAFNRRAVYANSGWFSLTYQVTKIDRWAVGYCIEDMAGSRIARTRNQIAFTNWTHNWTDALLTGLECSYCETDWLDTATGRAKSPGRNMRCEMIFRYTF